MCISTHIPTTFARRYIIIFYMFCARRPSSAVCVRLLPVTSKVFFSSDGKTFESFPAQTHVFFNARVPLATHSHRKRTVRDFYSPSFGGQARSFNLKKRRRLFLFFSQPFYRRYNGHENSDRMRLFFVCVCVCD